MTDSISRSGGNSNLADIGRNKTDKGGADDGNSHSSNSFKKHLRNWSVFKILTFGDLSSDKLKINK